MALHGICWASTVHCLSSARHEPFYERKNKTHVRRNEKATMNENKPAMLNAQDYVQNEIISLRSKHTNSYSRPTHQAQMMMMREARSLVRCSTKLNTSYKAAWQSSSALSVQSCCLQTKATRPLAVLQHFHKHISGFPLLENLPSLYLAHIGIIFAAPATQLACSSSMPITHETLFTCFLSKRCETDVEAGPLNIYYFSLWYHLLLLVQSLKLLLILP